MITPTHPDYLTTWSTFFYNIQAVKSLGTPQEASAIISAGEDWNGHGWTTGRASKVLYEITGVPLVSGNLTEYKGSFLYALALHWGVDLATFDLTEKAAEAAFALAGVLGDQGPGDFDNMEGDEDEEEESDPDNAVFPWEEKLTDLPSELAVLWKRYAGSGAGRFDTKGMLDEMPRFNTLPCKAPDNNVLAKYEQSGSAGKLDKAL